MTCTWTLFPELLPLKQKGFFFFLEKFCRVLITSHATCQECLETMARFSTPSNRACFLGVQTSECQMCTKNFLTHSLTFVQFYPHYLGLMPLFLCAHDCSQIAVDSNRDRLGNSCCVGWKTLSFFHPSSICALFPKKISHFPLDFLMYFLCTPSRTQGTP